MAVHPAQHYTELVKQAKAVEEDGELEKAAELYELSIRQEPLEEWPYARLMKIYRQQKEYKQERRVIEKALKVFQAHYDKKGEKRLGKKGRSFELSKALLKAVEGKNSEHYYPEPIPKWMKRKLVVEKKLGR